MIEFVQDAGGTKLRQRVDLLRESLRRVPGNPEFRRALCRALLELGDAPGAVAATEGFTADRELATLRIAAQLKLGETDAALVAAWSLHATAPDEPQAGRTLLDALKVAGLTRERSRAAAGMAWLAEHPRYRLGILAADVELGEAMPADLLACCDEILGQSTGHVQATYYRAIALALLGRDDEASETLALDRHLTIGELAADLPALAAEIRANPTLLADPGLNSTAHGRQTLQLLQPGDSAIPALLAGVEAAVRDYAAERAGQGDPLSASMPARARLRSWAVVLGAEGHQNPHLHPGGWLSGVFYVTAPRTDRYHGVLRVGPVGRILPGDPPWGVREIEPVPGRLVLFPSWTPHATEPPGVPGERIVIAFDVIRLDAS
ncbi:putative 2OG-Fe(II) oxygenase [Sphingomonas sp. AOB5]|uniref:putative 2OG-Fe(II) oxygenase n=1 Tax=Sphingomonas sp. AOB5 TaxID=3034017 RepID=UPI0023F8473E|nr:putative 2OG-Fe(II) oxygenase [Sphingomonas sp. AOB5]MDF7776829.1 putative 2OG-Fe(II) oxygenase [Sphingomonas sp. AOB5]